MSDPVAGSLIDGRKTVTTAGTAEALSTDATHTRSITICAETDNTGVIVVGASTVVAALGTRRGIPLNAGDSITVNVNSLKDVFLDTTVNGDGVTFYAEVW